MEGAVAELDLDIDHGVSGDDPILQRIPDPLVHSGNVLLGNDPADNGVGELISRSRLAGLNIDNRVSELPSATRLLDEFLFRGGRLGDGFAIGDLWLADIGVDLNSRMRRSTMISMCSSPMPEIMV